MLTGLVQVRMVQLLLNELFSDKDAPIGDIHGKLMETCYIGTDNNYCKILQSLQRRVYGPVTCLNKLTEESRANGLCLWHGSLSEEQCEKCPV